MGNYGACIRTMIGNIEKDIGESCLVYVRDNNVWTNEIVKYLLKIRIAARRWDH